MKKYIDVNKLKPEWVCRTDGARVLAVSVKSIKKAESVEIEEMLREIEGKYRYRIKELEEALLEMVEQYGTYYDGEEVKAPEYVADREAQIALEIQPHESMADVWERYKKKWSEKNDRQEQRD